MGTQLWPFDPALEAHGATFVPAAVQPGLPYWRLLSANGPTEWGGRHSIFVDTIGEAGQRLLGVPVRFWWADDDDTRKSEAKAGEPFALDLPIFAQGNAYNVTVADGLPSDQLLGLGLVAFQPHVSYRLVFQRTLAQAPLPTLPTTPTLLEAIQQARHWLDVAEGLL